MTNTKWEEAKRLNMECPHGNYIGWCDDCTQKYQEYVQLFISSLLSKSLDDIKAIISKEEKEVNNTIEVWEGDKRVTEYE